MEPGNVLGSDCVKMKSKLQNYILGTGLALSLVAAGALSIWTYPTFGHFESYANHYRISKIRDILHAGFDPQVPKLINIQPFQCSLYGISAAKILAGKEFPVADAWNLPNQSQVLYKGDAANLDSLLFELTNAHQELQTGDLLGIYIANSSFLRPGIDYTHIGTIIVEPDGSIKIAHQHATTTLLSDVDEFLNYTSISNEPSKIKIVMRAEQGKNDLAFQEISLLGIPTGYFLRGSINDQSIPGQFINRQFGKAYDRVLQIAKPTFDFVKEKMYFLNLSIRRGTFFEDLQEVILSRVLNGDKSTIQIKDEDLYSLPQFNTFEQVQIYLSNVGHLGFFQVTNSVDVVDVSMLAHETNKFENALAYFGDFSMLPMPQVTEQNKPLMYAAVNRGEGLVQISLNDRNSDRGGVLLTENGFRVTTGSEFQEEITINQKQVKAAYEFAFIVDSRTKEIDYSKIKEYKTPNAKILTNCPEYTSAYVTFYNGVNYETYVLNAFALYDVGKMKFLEKEKGLYVNQLIGAADQFMENNGFERYVLALPDPGINSAIVLPISINQPDDHETTYLRLGGKPNAGKGYLSPDISSPFLVSH